MTKYRYFRNDRIFFNVEIILRNALFGRRDRLVIVLNSTPKSNATKVDSGSSNYVSDFESIVANPDNITMRSIKLPQSVGTSLENQRRRYQHRKASFRDENISSGKIKRYK